MSAPNKSFKASSRIARLVIVLFGLLILSATWELLRASEMDVWVHKAGSISTRLAQLMNDVVDTEAGQRALLMSSESKIHQHYQQSLANIRDDFRYLDECIIDPSQQERLEVLERSVNKRLDLIARVVAEIRKSGLEKAHTRIVEVQEKALHDHVRFQIMRMLQAEDEILENRIHKASSDRLTSTVLLLCGGIIGVVVLLLLLTRLNEVQNEVHDLSVQDDLTGLLNRRGFLWLAEQQLKLARRSQMHCAVLFADLDGLKQINDTLGHNAGSDAIMKMGEVLKQTLRESDLVARWGGDEFVVLATITHPYDRERICDRIQSAIKAHNAEKSQTYKLAASIGSTLLKPTDAISLTEVIHEADALMYKDKRDKKLPPKPVMRESADFWDLIRIDETGERQRASRSADPQSPVPAGEVEE